MLYAQTCSAFPNDRRVILAGSQRVEGASELFYTRVKVSDQSVLRGMLDSGSMSCTLSEGAECKLRDTNVLPCPQPVPSNVILVGCGGLMTQPKCIYELDIDVFGFKFTVPTFVVPGQRDELIVGSNVIRPIIQKMQSTDKYWELISSSNSDPDCEWFIQLLSCISRWSGPELRDVVGTVKMRQAVTLLPQREYVVWGKLPSKSPISPGSTVMVGPTSARLTPKNILVGRVVTPMWGDRWIHIKVLNPAQNAITLRRNAKIADVLFIHRIHHSDDRPFRLPFCRVPPSHYQKLREVLSDMEMKGIISKSVSEYASPLVMVWKKNGDLRVCTDAQTKV